MKKPTVAFIILVFIIGLLALNCQEESSEQDELECRQEQDCGPGGRAEWKCFEHKCVSLLKYCEDIMPDDPICDYVLTDGDVDVADSEMESADQEHICQPCEYQCCHDCDCPEGYYCDVSMHMCFADLPCEPEKECCSDHDCWVNPDFGEGFKCIRNFCVDPDNPCPYECCTQQDCIDKYGAGWVCDISLGQCYENVIRCTPGFKQCCGDDPGNPDCLALTVELADEGILTCNSTGDNWELSMCDPFNSCFSFGSGTIECIENGRCLTTDDCPCPKQCIEADNRLICKLPRVGEDEVCIDDRCGGEPDWVSRCDVGLVCCLGWNQSFPEYGYCVPEASCGRK